MSATPPAYASGSAPRIPGEFRYWQNLDTPAARRRRRVLKALFGVDPVLPDDAIRRFAASYYDADPVAERFVEEVYLGRSVDEGRAMVEGALARGVDAVEDAPASLKALFAEVEERPDWVDWRLVEEGARVFRRWGTDVFTFAGAITLHGYLESSVAKPLALTGAYAGASANKRFLETAQFWVDVAAPGGLSPGGLGVKTALRVRLMHVLVRARLMEHPEWDLDAWGVPISQGDALLTLMGGSLLPGYLLRVMGYRTTREEIEATLHFWRYVGHLVGVQPRFYPESIEEAVGLMFVSEVKGARTAGEDAVKLARGFVELYDQDDGAARGLVDAVARRWETALHKGTIGLYLPTSTRRTYGVEGPRHWPLLPLARAPMVFLGETVRRRSKRVDAWWDARVQARTRRWLAEHLGERSVEYRAVDQFSR